MDISGWIPRSIRTLPSIKRDAALLPTLFLYNFFVFSSWTQLSQVATRPWLLLVWLYGLAGLVPLIFRDRAPVTVFIIQCAHTMAAWPFLDRYIPIVGIPVALYTVSAHRNNKISMLALLTSFIPNGVDAVAVFTIYPTTEATERFIPNTLFVIAASIGAWGAGRLTQTSQRRVQRLEREQRTAREATQEAVRQERRRIARDIHDIVSHTVTAIVLQAAAAAQDPEINTQVRQSLTNIQMMGQQAMAELRRLLGILVRSDPNNHAAGRGELSPQLGLADLPTLLDKLDKIDGMPVTIYQEGARRSLDPSLDLAAYRIAQEGLNNVLKHAGEERDPTLRLTWGTQDLIIEIDNGAHLARAPHRQALSVGHGLVGLRERAHALGGHLRAGPHSEVGYRLTATLPFAAPAVPPRISSTIESCPCPQGPGTEGKYEHDQGRGGR